MVVLLINACFKPAAIIACMLVVSTASGEGELSRSLRGDPEATSTAPPELSLSTSTFASAELGKGPVDAADASTIVTTTSVFKCQPPEVAWQLHDLSNYVSCVRDHCEEMSGAVLQEASEGRITGCFLLLEAAGGCSSNASEQVVALEALNETFQVGDLCGQLCSRCAKPDARRPSQSGPTMSAIAEESEASEAMKAPESQPIQSTVAATTVESVPIGKQRVLLGQLYIRLKSAETFAAHPGLMKALRDGIAAAMSVSPSKVFIIEIRALEGAAPAPASRPVAGRLPPDDGQVLGTVEVSYEIIDAPSRLDAPFVTNDMTAASLQEHFEQLLAQDEIQGDIAGVNLNAPEEELREILTSSSRLPLAEEVVPGEESTTRLGVNGCAKPGWRFAGFVALLAASV
mmetsp:Transcript_78517/g.138310  ORF Transcript_78517/g.138310 Transcript_78517/m.138310 type:complete len:402 (+) Transcript_78517:123-1328(+)